MSKGDLLSLLVYVIVAPNQTSQSRNPSADHGNWLIAINVAFALSACVPNKLRASLRLIGLHEASALLSTHS
jgi:hypothetical protein